MSRQPTLTEQLAAHIERQAFALRTLLATLDEVKLHPTRLSEREALEPSVDALLATGVELVRRVRAAGRG